MLREGGAADRLAAELRVEQGIPLHERKQLLQRFDRRVLVAVLCASALFGCATGSSDSAYVDAGDDAFVIDTGAEDDAAAIDSTSTKDTGAAERDSSAPLSDGGFDGGTSADSASTSADTGAPDTTPVVTDTGTAFDTGTTVTDTGKTDTGTTDTGTTVSDTAPSGPISGGPCMSGAPGATALRIRFYSSGGKVLVSYEKWGLPDASRQKAGIYGYTIGYTPSWDGWGEGGLLLNSSNFVDIELSTVGLSSISKSTLSLYGHSYTSTGSFSWQTFDGSGATPPNSMSGMITHAWSSGDATAAFPPAKGGALLRIKAGPSSNSLVVNRIELCMQAS